MYKKRFTALLLLTQVCLAADKPNILFLLSDDQRTDTIHALGNPHIITPALDQLVENGMVFQNTYCMGSMSGAVCAPSRAMILTGRSLFQIPLSYTVPWSKSIAKNHRGEVPFMTLPEALRYEGYTTFVTGKWHQEAPTLHRGFSHGANIFMGGMGSHTKLLLHDHDPEGTYAKEDANVVEGFSSTLFADATIDFLSTRKKDKPFFAWVAFTAPHDPRTPPDEILARYDAKMLPLPANYRPFHAFNNGELTIRDEKLASWPRTPAIVRKELASYYAMITQMDEQIGRILKALEESGEAGNTYVVFASDHGLAIGSHGLMGKQNLYEHSIKAPLIVRGPGVHKGKRKQLLYLFDLYPTFCELAGIPVPATVEGISFKPVLMQETYEGRKVIFTAYRDVQRALRFDRWKIIRYPQVNRTQLFDLGVDPEETTDLFYNEELEPIRNHLLHEMKKWQESFNDDQALEVERPFPAGYDPRTLNPPKRRK